MMMKMVIVAMTMMMMIVMKMMIITMTMMMMIPSSFIFKDDSSSVAFNIFTVYNDDIDNNYRDDRDSEMIVMMKMIVTI